MNKKNPLQNPNRLPFLDFSRWFNALLKLCIVCVLLCTLLGLKIYMDLDMWRTSGEVQTHRSGPCTEESFSFPAPAACDTFHDFKLLKRCGVLDKFEGNAITPTVKNETNNRDNNRHSATLSPDLRQSIKTKCGSVKPVPISQILDGELDTQSEDYVVPNVVHYVSLGSWEFKFLNYLSFLSVHKFIKPLGIFVHGDVLPHGYWWNKTLADVTNIYHVFRQRPIGIQGWKVRWVEHSSDILRLQTLLDNGGIYLDTDVLVVKSFDPLRTHDVTLGRESPYGLGNSIILSSPSSPFLCVWMSVYARYAPYPWNWAAYSVWAPNKLQKLLPNNVHVEQDSLLKPSWTEADLLYDRVYDWSDNYAVHVWKRYSKTTLPDNPENIKHLNSTLGQIMRLIYFDSKNIFPSLHNGTGCVCYAWSNCLVIFVIIELVLYI